MSAAQPIVLYFDYVDPASFLLERRLRPLLQGHESELTLEPLEVRPPPLSLLDPEDGPWRERWEDMAPEARTRSVPLADPWIVPWTRKAHELARHARDKGRFREIHDALFQAFLEEGRDIGRVDVLTELAGEHGLDRSEAKAVLDVDRYSEEVEAARARAEAAGITRVPTLLWKDRILEGYPDPESLDRFLAPQHNFDEPQR